MKNVSSSASTTKTRWQTMGAVLITIVALLASTTGTAEAQRDVRPDRVERDVVSDRAQPVPVVETLRLRCAADFIDGQRGVLCEWSEAMNPRTRAYQLYKTTNGSARELVVTRSTGGRLGFFDTDVTAPSSLVYGVISLNRSGQLIGRSAPQSVQFGADIAELRLSCAPDFLDGSRGVLCRWSEATNSHVRGYILYRSVGDQARQPIARVGLDGRLAFFDTAVRPGAVHVYGVTAVGADGSVLAVSGPQRVLWPVAD